MDTQKTSRSHQAHIRFRLNMPGIPATTEAVGQQASQLPRRRQRLRRALPDCRWNMAILSRSLQILQRQATALRRRELSNFWWTEQRSEVRLACTRVGPAIPATLQLRTLGRTRVRLPNSST